MIWWLRNIFRAGPSPGGGSPSDSPTGRIPKLLWTSALQATFNQMKADYDANPSAPATLGGRLHKTIKSEADDTAGFFSYGGYETRIFQATGDVTYADKAWAALNRSGTNPATTSPGSGSFFTRTGSGLGSNFGREFSIEYVLMYDWLYPGLSDANRTTFLSKLNDMFTYQSTEAVSLTANDSDQTTGTWLGLRCFYQATKDHNPTAVTLMAIANQGDATPTAQNYATKRNAIYYYCTVPAVGGEWMESSEYNTGTTRLLTLGVKCLQTTEDATAFAEVDALLPNFCRRMIAMSTADFLQAMQWGDEQEPRLTMTSGLYKWLSSCLAYVGALPNSSTERQWLQRYLLNLFTALGEPSGLTFPVSKAFFLYDPYATAAADLSAFPKGWYASGNGMMVWHNNIASANESHFWAHFRPEHRRVDHLTNYFGDYQLYRKGEFVITHPIAYSASGLTGQGVSYLADMCNCTTVESFSGVPGWSNNLSVFQFRRVVAQRFGSGSFEYAYICATQGGMIHPTLGVDGNSNYFDPPPAFIHEWTKSVVLLPSGDGTADSIVVVERINAEDPEVLTKFARYRTANPPEQTLITAQPRWAAYLHQGTNPVVTSNLTEWTTAGGQLAKDEWLLPAVAGVTITEQDETSLSPYDCISSEKRWRTKVTPNSATQWTVLVRVVSARDSGKTHTSTLLTGTSASYGVLVTRTGNDDRVVIVNGTQGSNLPGSGFPSVAQCVTALLGVHLRATTFTIGWTQVTTTAKVLICDLDPAHAWTTNLDAAGAVSLTVDANGTGELTVTGTGAHSIVFGVT